MLMMVSLRNIDIFVVLNCKKMNKYYQLKDLVASAEADAQKFHVSGNAAAGTRVRKVMQEIKILALAIRTEITEIKNAEK